MKEIEKEFIGKGEVSGTSFKQIEKSDKAFVYELTDEESERKRLRNCVDSDLGLHVFNCATKTEILQAELF